jgi:acyl-CoA dehydrogenase
LGGHGYGQVKLALLNELLGRTRWAPFVFGTQAPDTGNAEILAHFGTPAQKEKYLKPLLEGEIFSCYSMTEPHAGSDPKMFKARAWREGGEWVIEGEKFFSSNAKNAEFLIVMAVTNPEHANPYERMSMFLVPSSTPGVRILRNMGHYGERGDEGIHAWIHYDHVRVPADAVLGGEGEAFKIAQTRLGGGRIHHAMRTIAACREAMDMMCERVLSRETQGEPLAKKQLVQAAISDSWTELTQFRLMVLYTAWLIDQQKGYTPDVRKHIAACKVETARIYDSIVRRAIHLHGALGISNVLPLGRELMYAEINGIHDGPTEVHQVTVARQVLANYQPSDFVFGSWYEPPKIEAAQKRYAEELAKVRAIS